MDTAYDLLQAIGLGLAFGLRPALAPLVVALLASAQLGLDLRGTVVADATEVPALAGFGLIAAVLLAIEVLRGPVRRPVILILAVALAALLGAGGFDEHAATWWPGAVAGAAGALLAWLALGPLVAGAQQRLAGERDAAVILPVVVELVAVVTAVLSVIFPPLAAVALVAVLVLLVRGRSRRDGQHAGLRTLTK